MKYFKNENNEVYAYDNKQVQQGYGKDLTSLEAGEFTDGVSIYPYKLDTTYIAIIRDASGNITAPQSLVDTLTTKQDKKLELKYTKAMEDLMDTNAKTKGYDNRYTAMARAGVANSPFQAEGQAFALWMDNCYETGYQILADIKAGTRELPNVEEFLVELPELVW